MLQGLNQLGSRIIMNTSKQKIAIITGGASGLGLAIARKFTTQNIFCVLIGRDAEKLDAAKKSLGKNCTTISYDLNNLAGIPALILSISQQYGPIDILVNNAGINQKKSLVNVTDTEFQAILHTNLTSVFVMSREVIKVMQLARHGVILNISSMAAQYGLPFVAAYAASKTGIEGLSRTMAVELAADGIRVNCIAPGFIATNMSSIALDSDPERKRKVLSRTPMAKLGSPEDIADAAYFLTASESSFITGVVLPVDGGNSIGF
jgi:NAD(P)-dependent dehydrogenase (short-subunit alcohol dehydrogenase family)